MLDDETDSAIAGESSEVEAMGVAETLCGVDEMIFLNRRMTFVVLTLTLVAV